MSNKKIVGAALTAAALAFVAIPATSALAAGEKGHVQCYGINACKGKSVCKTAHNACKGQNSCKGKGVVIKKTKVACKKAGGSTVAPAE